MVDFNDFRAALQQGLAQANPDTRARVEGVRSHLVKDAETLNVKLNVDRVDGALWVITLLANNVKRVAETGMPFISVDALMDVFADFSYGLLAERNNQDTEGFDSFVQGVNPEDFNDPA